MIISENSFPAVASSRELVHIVGLSVPLYRWTDAFFHFRFHYNKQKREHAVTPDNWSWSCSLGSFQLILCFFLAEVCSVTSAPCAGVCLQHSWLNDGGTKRWKELNFSRKCTKNKQKSHTHTRFAHKVASGMNHQGQKNWNHRHDDDVPPPFSSLYVWWFNEILPSVSLISRVIKHCTYVFYHVTLSFHAGSCQLNPCKSLRGRVWARSHCEYLRLPTTTCKSLHESKIPVGRQ